MVPPYSTPCFLTFPKLVFFSVSAGRGGVGRAAFDHYFILNDACLPVDLHDILSIEDCNQTLKAREERV